MYSIGENILIARAEDIFTYKGGVKLYEDKKVSSIKTNKDKSYFQAYVEDGEIFLPKIRFKADGSVRTTNCNCPNSKRTLGDCVHIIALFKFIDEYQTKIKEKELEEEKLKDFILRYVDKGSKDRIYLDIEYNIEILENEPGALLSMRIGQDRLYLIRDMKEFFDHYKRRDLEFGKFFTYKWEVNRFKPEDRSIIRLLSLIHENAYEYSSEDNKRLLKSRDLYLTDKTLERVLEKLVNRRFNLIFNGIKYENIKIEEDNIQLSLKIQTNEDKLTAELIENSPIGIITESKKFAISDGKIYKASEGFSEKVIPLYEQIVLKGGGEIEIPQKFRASYISDVIRSVDEYVDIEFSEEVEEMIEEPNLEAKIYFDSEEDSIVGTIDFVYEDTVINPFSSDYNPEFIRDKILIRNSEIENKILKILEKGYFKVVDGGIYLEKDEEIYSLVSEIIPELQEYAEIYYSKDLKRIKVLTEEVRSKISYNRDLNLLGYSFQIDDREFNEIDNIIKAINKNKKYLRLESGDFLPLDNERFSNLGKWIEEYGGNIKGDSIEFPKYMGYHLIEELKNSDTDTIIEDSFEELMADIENITDEDYPIDEDLIGIMRDYQIKGYNWLKTRAKYSLAGILADDMGLGKTLQIISYLKAEEKSTKSLIIVPTSLVYNWQAELKKFAPDLKVTIIRGNKLERDEIINNIDRGIYITSYPLIRNDIESFENIIFDNLILDEAQNIKNHQSVNAKSVKRLKSKVKFALTGTPMENNLSELWSIFDFLMPKYLYNYRKFVEEFENPIVLENSQRALAELEKKINPFILRRMKKDVLKELPDKFEQTVMVNMTSEQKSLYAQYADNFKRELFEENKKEDQMEIFTALTRLRQIACDPKLFIEDYSGGSGKLESLMTILEDGINSQSRILVFSQFTSMLDIIKKELEKKSISYMYLEGSTPADERLDMVNEFNDGDIEVFLISLKAGGSGLNLVGADMVVHYDPWWNPAVEEQATDRVYRIGQENSVQIIKLIAKGTIEEKIFELQKEKLEMIDMIIKKGETLLSKLSKDELLSLFTNN